MTDVEQQRATGPLGGVRILDMTMNMSGPLATMMLADQGAQVIKIEPPDGDVVRRLGSAKGDTSPYFANLNRNKRSVVVDVRRPAGLDIVHRLAATSDVFIQNLRYGVAERLGVGHGALQQRNPRLVYVSITGYGSTGPLHDQPAYDHVIQALSGIAARQGGRDGNSGLVRHGIIDKATAYAAAQAVSTALFARERTGEASVIELSLLDNALNFLWPDGMMGHSTIDPGTENGREVASSYRTTRTLDGNIVLMTLTDAQWRGLVAAVGLEQDDRTASLANRQRHGGDTMREVARRLKELPRDEALDRLREHGVPCAPVVDLDRVHEVAQIVAAEALVEYQHPVLGTLRQPHPAARFDSGRRAAPNPAPGMGADTEAVLRELGISDDAIEELRASGIVSR